MRTICNLVVVVTLLSLLVACDQRAQQRAAADKQFEQALRALDAANLGFVPTEREEHTLSDDSLSSYAGSIGSGDMEAEQADVEVYRQAKLEEAVAALEPIIQNGLPRQQRDARRLTADIYASRARFIEREAMTNWAALSNRSTVLVSYMIAAARAQARVRSYDVDDQLLRLRLEDDKSKARDQLDSYNRQAKTLELEVSQLKSQIKKLRDEAQKHRDKQQKLKNEAFPLEGDQRWETYNRAAEEETKAHALESKAQQLSFDLDIAASRLDILNKQIQFTQKFLKSVDRELENTLLRNEEIKSARGEAGEEQQLREENFIEEMGSIVKAYNEAVQTKFAEAVEVADKAIEQLEQAAQSASGQEKREIEFEKCAKLLNKLEIYVSHAMTSNDIGGKLATISQRASADEETAVMGTRSTFISTTAKQFSDDQILVLSDAKSVVGDSIALANSLIQGAADDDSLAGDVNRQRAIIERYNDRLDKLNLGGYTGPVGLPETASEDAPSGEDSSDAEAASEEDTAVE